MNVEHLEYAVANQNIELRELRDRVAELAKTARKTPNGLILPENVTPGPGAAVLSRQEFERVRGGLADEIEGLKATVASLANELGVALRILDRMAGME